MMQIWFLSYGSYSLNKCHNPFGKAIQPPPPYGKIPVEHGFSLRGASLTPSACSTPLYRDFITAETSAVLLGALDTFGFHFAENLGKVYCTMIQRGR